MNKEQIEQAKREMLLYVDFYGGELCNKEDIEFAETKDHLIEILDKHFGHMQSMLSDAERHLDNLQQKLQITSF